MTLSLSLGNLLSQIWKRQLKDWKSQFISKKLNIIEKVDLFDLLSISFDRIKTFQFYLKPIFSCWFKIRLQIRIEKFDWKSIWSWLKLIWRPGSFTSPKFTKVSLNRKRKLKMFWMKITKTERKSEKDSKTEKLTLNTPKWIKTKK